MFAKNLVFAVLAIQAPLTILAVPVVDTRDVAITPSGTSSVTAKSTTTTLETSTTSTKTTVSSTPTTVIPPNGPALIAGTTCPLDEAFSVRLVVEGPNMNVNPVGFSANSISPLNATSLNPYLSTCDAISLCYSYCLKNYHPTFDLKWSIPEKTWICTQYGNGMGIEYTANGVQYDKTMGMFYLFTSYLGG